MMTQLEQLAAAVIHAGRLPRKDPSRMQAERRV